MELKFEPSCISISSADLILTDQKGNKMHIFTLFDEKGEFGNKWRKKREVGKGEAGKGNLQFNGPCGVAILPENFIVVCDRLNSRLQFFSLAGDFIRTFKPKNENGENYFQWPFGVTIFPNNGLILVSDIKLNSLSLFRSSSIKI